MIFNQFPYTASDYKKLYQNVSSNKLNFPSNIYISDDLKNILEKMLEINET